MHVEFETFFEKVGRHDLFFQFSGSARLFGCLLRLLFQFDAFEPQQIFGALDGIFQGAIRVVEHRTLLETPSALLIIGLSEDIGMKAAAQRIEFFFERGGVQVELAWKSEEGEVIYWRWRLHLAARTTEVHRAHRAA